MSTQNAKREAGPEFWNHLIDAGDVAPAWLASDNGFTRLTDMLAAHKPIVEAVGNVLTGRAGKVIDLGCGNGFLLAELCRGVSGVSPVGIEQSSQRLARARELFRDAPVELHLGDLLDCDLAWPCERRYEVALLMPGRLIEADRERTLKLRRCLSEQVDVIFAYAYSDWLDRFGNTASLCNAAGLVPVGPIVTGIGSALVQIEMA